MRADEEISADASAKASHAPVSMERLSGKKQCGFRRAVEPYLEYLDRRGSGQDVAAEDGSGHPAADQIQEVLE